MKTIEETVVGDVSIWAIPKDKYYMEQNPNALPFEYRLSTKRLWEDGAVKVLTQEITLTVPEGVDLLKAAVATMKAEIQEVRATAQKRVENIQDRIDSLLMLTHMEPEGNGLKSGDAFNDELENV